MSNPNIIIKHGWKKQRTKMNSNPVDWKIILFVKTVITHKLIYIFNTISIKIQLPFCINWVTIWPICSLLKYILRKTENICPPKNLYTNFHKSIFITVPKGKPSKCSGTDEQIDKMWYIHTMECFSVIKRKKVHAIR